jgi:hypothetical protein
MLLIKELTTACPNTDPLARHVVEVSALDIYTFSSESMIWMPRVTKKLLSTSLPLSTCVLSHENLWLKYTRTSWWFVKMMHT